jgi:DNA mismatch endonuclease Vsr
MDKLTKEQRRKNMQAVKSKDSKIEIRLRKELWKRGCRYRKNYSKLPGKPDIALVSFKIAVFCDSEFWHGYDWNNQKKRFSTNKDYWVNKIEANILRDRSVDEKLENLGWIVLRFWGKEIEKDLEECLEMIEKAIKKKSA